MCKMTKVDDRRRTEEGPLRITFDTIIHLGDFVRNTILILYFRLASDLTKRLAI